MPIVWILVGVPGSGKSTWIQNNFYGQKRIVVASTDKYVERFARERGTTYSEVFNQVMPDALKLMLQDVQRAVNKNSNLVWDQTSTTKFSRLKKLRMIPSHYEKVAVVFPTPDSHELQRRLNNRPGKIIPPEVLSEMQENFVMPSLDEGFDRIIVVDK